ncbi:transcriptional regulator FtsR [Actinokineospora pegani]|uniref:transcriptional regulator FtsR n=1 Tax=Actinokineospora pegani TaxID=2654637 RepID=UPI0012E9FE5F|nr:MerR family transcriptional regulator [Actinokineospora pegani]
MAGGGRPDRDGASIGAVLEALRPDFPDVTISKIRFLESEGLVTPERTPSGYRRFTDSDVDRLRYVLSAQRDQYLPLKVIRERLDRGAPRRPAVVALVEPAPTNGLLTRAEVAERAEVSAEFMRELEEYALLRPGSDGRFDAAAVAIAQTVSALAGHGIEPRHLRAHRAAADRAVGLVEQVVAPMRKQRDPAAGKRAAEVADELAELSVGLHALLVRTGLRG